MEKKNREFGIYFTDASFDHKTKTASIGIINIQTQETYSYAINAKSPLEAEEFGIIKSLDLALSDRLFNSIVFCDNKYAINNIRKQIIKDGSIKRFWKLQLVWLPREFNQVADMLSKNINETEVDALKELKENNLASRNDYMEEKFLRVYTKDIELNKDKTILSLLKRIEQFKLLYKSSYKEESNSAIINELISDHINIKSIESMVLDPKHINDFENERKKLKNEDQILVLLLNTIRDSIIMI